MCLSKYTTLIINKYELNKIIKFFIKHKQDTYYV